MPALSNDYQMRDSGDDFYFISKHAFALTLYFQCTKSALIFEQQSNFLIYNRRDQHIDACTFSKLSLFGVIAKRWLGLVDMLSLVVQRPLRHRLPWRFRGRPEQVEVPKPRGKRCHKWSRVSQATS